MTILPSVGHIRNEIHCTKMQREDLKPGYTLSWLSCRPDWFICSLPARLPEANQPFFIHLTTANTNCVLFYPLNTDSLNLLNQLV